jgi:hypothetical protein
MRANTIKVQGTVYDAKTGKPLRTERGDHTHGKHAAAVHARTQHSQTLSRRYVTNPAKQTIEVKKRPAHVRPVVAAPAASAPTPGHKITKYAPQAQPQQSRAHQGVISDIGPMPHPMAVKVQTKQAHSRVVPIAPHTAKPSSVIKNEAIAHASQQMKPNTHRKQVRSADDASPRARRLSLASAALAFMIFSGYLTYLYMPNLTTRVAAAQAGIDAQYPGYQPSGYRLSGPVAYQPGEVSMKFAANAGPSSYTLTQRRSAWDSTAVLDKYIEPKADNNYSATRVNGLTVYTYDTNAAWVNDGILYTISGNAPLSSDQVQRIATSL